MIRAIALIFLLAMVTVSAAAQQDEGLPWYKKGELWTGNKWKDSAWIGMNAGFVLDWAQTRYIADHPDNFYEMNSILGEHPTSGDVNRYFIATIIESNAIYYFMPDSWKPVLSGLYIVRRYDAISTNKELGVKFQF